MSETHEVECPRCGKAALVEFFPIGDPESITTERNCQFCASRLRIVLDRKGGAQLRPTTVEPSDGIVTIGSDKPPPFDNWFGKLLCLLGAHHKMNVCAFTQDDWIFTKVICERCRKELEQKDFYDIWTKKTYPTHAEAEAVTRNRKPEDSPWGKR